MGYDVPVSPDHHRLRRAEQEERASAAGVDVEPHTGSHPPQFPTATGSNGEASRAGESGAERGSYSGPGCRHFAGEVLSQNLLIILFNRYFAS